MKNYKKIYNRFRKEITKLIDEEYRYNQEADDFNEREKLIREIESEYAINTLEIILNIADEIEGKECHMQIMNKYDFRNWKEKIKK